MPVPPVVKSTIGALLKAGLKVIVPEPVPVPNSTRSGVFGLGIEIGVIWHQELVPSAWQRAEEYASSVIEARLLTLPESPARVSVFPVASVRVISQSWPTSACGKVSAKLPPATDAWTMQSAPVNV